MNEPKPPPNYRCELAVDRQHMAPRIRVSIAALDVQQFLPLPASIRRASTSRSSSALTRHAGLLASSGNGRLTWSRKIDFASSCDIRPRNVPTYTRRSASNVPPAAFRSATTAASAAAALADALAAKCSRRSLPPTASLANSPAFSRASCKVMPRTPPRVVVADLQDLACAIRSRVSKHAHKGS